MNELETKDYDRKFKPVSPSVPDYPIKLREAHDAAMGYVKERRKAREEAAKRAAQGL